MNSSYQPPRKALLTPAQLEWFKTSETYKILTEYVEALNESVVGVKLSDDVHESAV